jgi:hypothetical protein
VVGLLLYLLCTWLYLRIHVTMQSRVTAEVVQGHDRIAPAHSSLFFIQLFIPGKIYFEPSKGD